MIFEVTLGNMIALLAIVWFGAYIVGTIDGYLLRRHMENYDRPR